VINMMHEIRGYIKHVESIAINPFKSFHLRKTGLVSFKKLISREALATLKVYHNKAPGVL
jgi:hypothetical protein